MKKLKKIWMGLSFLLLALLTLSPKVLADGGPINGTSEWRNATYTMNQKSQIITNLAGRDHDNIVFTDSAPTDAIHNYVADTNGTGVCSGSITFDSGQNFSNHPVAGSINVKFQDSSGPIPSCENGGNGNYSGSISIINNTSNNGQTAADTGPAQITYNGNTYSQINTGTDAVVYGLSKSTSSCYGGTLLVLNKIDSKTNAPVNGTVIGTGLKAGPHALSDYVNLPASFPIDVGNLGQCTYDPNNGADAVVKVAADGTATYVSCPTWNTSCQAGATTTTSSNSGTAQSCVGADVGDGDLDWIICPIVKGVGEAGNLMNGFIQGQLNYDVGANLGGTTGSIHKAWTIFKNLISAILVIIMLVMVISQAVGGGPFEAYTIRKILPKLVVAVIGMQISWSVGIYLIQLANDAGQGIGQLIAAPFGGLAALDLPALMARLHPAWSATFGGWVGVLVVGIGVYLFWPMMLLGAFTLLVAVAAAMATLLIRNALIVLAIISAPLAILAWVMPGTQKFWKYWSSNFSKALMLFPLVMGLIYGGRIFGWVAGNLGNPGPFDFLMVFAGFVGPYIFLPKTFKWGGSILAQANQGVIKARDQLSKKPSEFFRNRQQGWNEERTRRSQERYANDVGFNPWRPWRRPLDLLKSGERDPTLWGRRRQRARDTYVKKGEDSYQEDLAAAEARLVRERQRVRSSGGNHDHFLQAIAEGLPAFTYEGYDHQQHSVPTGGRSAIERNAARKQIAMLGAGTNYRYLEHYYEGTMANGSPQEKADMRKFFDDNVDTLRTRLPHLYKGIGSTSDAAPESIAQMHGAEIESMLGNLSHIITTGTNIHGRPANRATAQRQLNTFLQNYLGAVKNSNLQGQLENGGLRAVKAFITDNDNIAADLLGTPESKSGINYEVTKDGAPEGRAVRGSIPIVPRSKDSADVAAAVANVKELDQLINEQGFIVGSPATGARTQATNVSSGGSAGSYGPGPQGPPRSPARAPGAGYEGTTAFGQPSASRSPGPLGAPSDFSIDHEAITNAVAEGVRQGAETLGQQVFENTLQAHRRAGLLDRRPVGEGTVQNITNIQGTTEGGVDIPRGVTSVDVPRPEPGEEIRPRDQQ